MAEKDDLGFIPDEQDDLGFVADEQEAPKKEKSTWSSMSVDKDTVRAAGSAAGDAVTLGLSDKLLGGAFAAGDILQRIASDATLGTIPKSTSQLNEELAAKGFDVPGPKSPRDVYYQNQEEIQAEQDRLASANPKTALLSALVGGGAGATGLMKAAPKAAGALFNAGGTAAKTAGLGEKIGRAAVSSIPLSVGTALESNTARYLEGEAPDLTEAGLTAGLGIGVGAAIPVVGAGLKAAAPLVDAGARAMTPVADALRYVPKKTVAGLGKLANKDAYEASVETGKYIASPEYSEEVLGSAKGLIEEVAGPVQAERARRSAILQKQQENIAAVEAKLAENEAQLKTVLKTATAEEKIALEKQLAQERQQLRLAKDGIKKEIEANNAAILEERKLQEQSIATKKTALKQEQELEKKAQEEAKAAYKKSIAERKQQDALKVQELENKRSELENSFQTANEEAVVQEVKAAQQAVDNMFDDASVRYNDFDESIDQSGVKFNFYPEVDAFLNSLEPQQRATFKSLENKSSVQNLDRLGFVTLRNQVDDAIRSTQDYSVKRKLRDLAGNLRKNQAETIKKQVGEDKYKELQELNKFYSDISKLDENYFTLDKATSAKKVLNVLTQAGKRGEAAAIARAGFQETLEPIPQKFKEQVTAPIQSRLSRLSSQEQQLADLDKTVKDLKSAALPEAPEFTPKDFSAQQQEIAEMGKTLPTASKNVSAAAKEAIAKNPQILELDSKIKTIQDKLQLIRNNHPEGLNSDAVRNAEKQIKLFELEKARVLDDLKLDKASTEEAFTTGSSRILNPKLLKTVGDVEEAIKSEIFNPSKDALSQTKDLNDLLAQHKQMTGKDITEQVKKLQQQAKFLDQEELNKLKLSGFDAILGVASPSIAAAKVTLGNQGILAKAASRAGRWNSTKQSINQASNKARSAGFNNLADRIAEIANLPEAEAAQKSFLLNQNPTFRKLFNTEEEK